MAAIRHFALLGTTFNSGDEAGVQEALDLAGRDSDGSTEADAPETPLGDPGPYRADRYVQFSSCLFDRPRVPVRRHDQPPMFTVSLGEPVLTMIDIWCYCVAY